jgi:hypothetical protein
MPTLITRFASLTNQSRDILSPVEHRTIVEMIRGILQSYQFKKLDGAVKLFYQHLASQDPLYAASGINFYFKIVESTYAVYVNMTPSPLPLEDFKTQIAGTLSFVELFRRIVLNRFMYDQLKVVGGLAPNGTPGTNGSVPAGTYSVYLSTDWPTREAFPNPVSLTIPSTLNTEQDFIRFGWQGSTTPVGFIFTAENIAPSRVDLPIVFSTTSEFTSLFTPAAPVTLPIASNDLTVHVRYTNNPAAALNLFTLQNNIDIISVDMAVNKTISVSLNTKKLLQTAAPSTDGRISLIVDSRGYLSLQITDKMFQLRTRERIVFKNDIPLNRFTVNAPYLDQFTTSFGLRSVTVFQGWEDFLPPDEIVVPLGYNLLVDVNGRYLCDRDGVPLMDVDIDRGADEAGNFVYLTDSDGSFVMDANGAYYIVPADEYYAIVDDDNALLLDDDGAYVIEPLTQTS